MPNFEIKSSAPSTFPHPLKENMIRLALATPWFRKKKKNIIKIVIANTACELLCARYSETVHKH